MEEGAIFNSFINKGDQKKKKSAFFACLGVGETRPQHVGRHGAMARVWHSSEASNKQVYTGSWQWCGQLRRTAHVTPFKGSEVAFICNWFIYFFLTFKKFVF